MKPRPRIQKAANALLDQIIDAEPKVARELTAKLFKRLTREPNRRLAKRGSLSTMKPTEAKP